MEKLSRHRTPALRRLGRAALAALCVSLGAAAPRAEATELDLVGTWYVLVHYTDDNSANPEQPRWEDRVWRFERKGSRLRWTEYPIVVFRDGSGRFERRSTGQYARVLHYWQPSERQLADIRDGLQVNNRGQKSKSLRGSDAEGWSSVGRARAASASIITYSETWSIEGEAGKPVFRRQDVLGSARTESLEGVTLYATTEVRDGELHGTFERDGTRHGTFRMMRSGATEGVEGSGKTQGQRAAEAFGVPQESDEEQ